MLSVTMTLAEWETDMVLVLHSFSGRVCGLGSRAYGRREDEHVYRMQKGIQQIEYSLFHFVVLLTYMIYYHYY